MEINLFGEMQTYQEYQPGENPGVYQNFEKHNTYQSKSKGICCTNCQFHIVQKYHYGQHHKCGLMESAATTDIKVKSVCDQIKLLPTK